MTRIELVYDGKTFQPVAPVNLPVGARLSAEWDENGPQRESAWEVLRRLAGTIDMPEDWSENHDAYLYGEKTEKTDK